MGSILEGKFIRSDMTSNAMGGTELLAHRLIDNVDSKLLQGIQIHQSRVNDVDETKKQVLWVHDLAEDPAVSHLKDEGWKKYDLIVFVSHWQQEQYKLFLGVPYDMGIVIPNAIVPIEDHKKPDDGVIRLIYTSTPQRGLQILAPIFHILSQKYSDIELDVFSSFKLYGWGERDEPFKPLFKELDDHPKINYHGAKSNDEVRETLKKSHIFAYPSIWKETSCLCLIEAMSANLLPVHSSLGALSETSMGMNMIYEYKEDFDDHARALLANLDFAIMNVKENRNAVEQSLKYRKPLIDNYYGVDRFANKWSTVLGSLLTKDQ
tara:strand:+ start:15399 stop:16361 length:963 start_codon:yes stop_codon:yes gene_type:complete